MTALRTTMSVREELLRLRDSWVRSDADPLMEAIAVTGVRGR